MRERSFTSSRKRETIKEEWGERNNCTMCFGRKEKKRKWWVRTWSETAVRFGPGCSKGVRFLLLRIGGFGLDLSCTDGDGGCGGKIGDARVTYHRSGFLLPKAPLHSMVLEGGIRES